MRYRLFEFAIWLARKTCVWGFTHDYLMQAWDYEYKMEKGVYKND